MWRVLVYLVVIAALAWGAVWLAERPGAIAFVWDGVSYSVSLAVAGLALLVIVAAILLIEAAARILLNLPQRLSGAARERKKRKAIQALSRGMVAVGSGDESAARRYAREAERYLQKDEPLLMLLKAQAAQISGDRDLAEQTFLEMTQNDETKVLGLRGLYVEARRRGDQQTAWRHASDAARLAPAVDWANEAVLEGLCARGDWRGALEAVERRAALGLIDKAAAKRQRAVLLTADALARGESDEDGALAAAREAVNLAPDLAPAGALAGRILGRRLELRKATNLLEAAWSACPHPDVADAYTHLRAGDSAQDRMKRAERLAVLANWTPEGRMALARAAIEARDFVRARQTLAPLLPERPTVGACVLMAELERAEKGSTAGAREWLARAVHAPRDKAWIADGVVSDRWSPVSPVSGRLDAFRWNTPPELISGAGASVFDDVLADLDDHPREPVAIAPPGARDQAEGEDARREQEKREQETLKQEKRDTASVVIPPKRPDSAPMANRDAVEAESVESAAPAVARTAPKPEPVSGERGAVESKPAAPEPVKSKPLEPKPLQSKPLEPKPLEPKPADSTRPDPIALAPDNPEVRPGAPAANLAASAAPGTTGVSAKPSPGASPALTASPSVDKPVAAGEPAVQIGGHNDRVQRDASQTDAASDTETDERIVHLTRPPDDPGVPPEDDEKPRKTSRFGFFG